MKAATKTAELFVFVCLHACFRTHLSDPVTISVHAFMYLYKAHVYKYNLLHHSITYSSLEIKPD